MGKLRKIERIHFGIACCSVVTVRNCIKDNRYIYKCYCLWGIVFFGGYIPKIQNLWVDSDNYKIDKDTLKLE